MDQKNDESMHNNDLNWKILLQIGEAYNGQRLLAFHQLPLRCAARGFGLSLGHTQPMQVFETTRQQDIQSGCTYQSMLHVY